jgi:hypothetical protein
VTPLESRREKLIVVPIDVLWQMIEPAENLPAWMPICDRREVVAADGSPRRLQLRAREIDADMTVELHDEGVGTRVTLTARHTPASWWSTLVQRVVVAPKIHKAFDRALSTLAAVGQ